MARSKKKSRDGSGLAKRYPCYLANAPVQPNADLEVRDKYSGKVATRVAFADAALVRKAIVAAYKAREARWRRSRPTSAAT